MSYVMFLGACFIGCVVVGLFVNQEKNDVAR